MRVGSVSNRGSSTLAGVEHRQRCRAPVPRRGPWLHSYTPLRSEAPVLSVLTSGVQGPGRGPLGLGVTGGGRGFWETQGDEPGDVGHVHARTDAVGMARVDRRAPFSDAAHADGVEGDDRWSSARFRDGPQWAGRETPLYDRAGRPLKGRKAIGRASASFVVGLSLRACRQAGHRPCSCQGSPVSRCTPSHRRSARASIRHMPTSASRRRWACPVVALSAAAI